MSANLSTWPCLGLTWLGRLAAIKMVYLPKILYLMLVLPLQPPPSALAKLQKLLESFVWGKRRPCMARPFVYLSLRDVGLGVSNLRNYYLAAQLRFLVEWHRPMSEKHWCFIDQSIARVHIWKVTWLRRTHRSWGVYSSLVLRATMAAWDSVAVSRGLTSFPSPFSSIIGNLDFTPALDGEGFRQ